jgi:peptidoglycan hydrolase-like protein with peptidoglycan-binding domain
LTQPSDDSTGSAPASGPPSAPPGPPPGSTSGGIAGEHKPRASLPLYVAPTPETDWNALRTILLPVACWRLEDLRFDFDSSFVRPEAALEMAALSTLRLAHPGAPLSVFGHADPVGADGYNKTLSGRRALAVYGLLVRDVAGWEKLYSNAFGGDDWGTRAIQLMVRALGFDPGHVDGKLGAHTKSAVEAYQQSKGLSVDGDPGPDTRKALFADYMGAICQDASGQPFTLTKTDFLNKGADGNLRGDVQGCSEFNLLVVFSTDEDQTLSKPENEAQRDADNLPNRRVLVFLFPPGSKIDVDAWPCPAANDGPSQCQSHFWPDGDTRRAPAAKHRVYQDTRDTMACRFYDRMARRSPCEVARTTLRLRLLNSENDFIPNAPYKLTLASGEVREGEATDDGWLVEQNIETPEDVHVVWGYPTDYGISSIDRAKRWGFSGPYLYSLDVALYTDDGASDEDKAREHLSNLGYPADQPLEDNLLYFQREYQVYPADGTLSDDTKAALAKVDEQGLGREEFIKQQADGGQ